jgi:hypothetical protein
MSKIYRIVIALILAASIDSPALAAEVANPSVAFIQRTMTKIAQSTPENPATVRFQFYGQSITAQAWTGLVSKDLAQRFPSVKFNFHNPAIGGFTSPALIRTAEHDLYPWYPDILVFHVYGPVDKYEEIIRNVRARTTAEIVLWTSHLNASETLDKNPDDDARIVAIRAIAKKYDCMLIDVRKKWIAYLREHQIEPKALLNDSVHLNQEGVKLMASFIGSELIHVPGLATTPQAGTVTDIPLDSPAVARDAAGELTLTFTGNRVVAISGAAVSGAHGEESTDVLLDGEPPGARPELWAVTRPSTGPKIWMPAIKQVSFEKAPLAEDWTLTCLNDSTPDAKTIHFRVTGSLTGEDGEGFSTERFVSQSGRVVIEPADWHLVWSLGYKKLTLPEGFQVTWRTYPLFTAKYQPQPAGTETVLAQNCAPTTHTLTLKGSADKLGITGFRVHTPAPSLVE